METARRALAWVDLVDVSAKVTWSTSPLLELQGRGQPLRAAGLDELAEALVRSVPFGTGCGQVLDRWIGMRDRLARLAQRAEAARGDRWTTMLPSAVASVAPASTVRPVVSAVVWHNSRFWEPRPTTWMV